jgi:hypothetical protein
MSDWFKQIALECLAMACLVTVGLLAPWLPLQLLAVLTGAFVIYSYLHHPRFFYRRIFFLAAMTFMLPALLDLTFSGAMRANLPEGGWLAGVLNLHAGEGSKPAWLFGLAVLCLIGDALQYKIVEESRSEAIRLTDGELRVYESGTTSGLDLRTHVTVVGPKDAAFVQGATVQVWFRRHSCQVHATQEDSFAPRLAIAAGQARKIAPAEAVTLFIHAQIPRGARATWLRWRASSPWLFTKFKGIRLIAAPRWMEEPLPLTLRHQKGSAVK